MDVQVTTTGPFFEGKADVKGGLRSALHDVAALGSVLMRRELAAIGRGPGRYGHIVDAVVTQVKVLEAGDMGARIFLRGKQAYRGAILAAGSPGHFIAARRKRVRIAGVRKALAGKNVPLAIPLGGRSSAGWSGVAYRQFAHHPGFAAIPFAANAEAALVPQIQGVVDRAMAGALGG